MSQILAQLQAEAAAAQAESGIDLNEIVKGGGGGRLLPAGYAFARLVEYIEFGQQPQEYQGKAKDPALEFSLGFALWGAGYQNDDGTPYIIRTFNTAQSQNEKSRCHKLFKSMNYKQTAKSFPQMLGEAFLLKIKHVPKDKNAPQGQQVSRVDEAGFLPPNDPVTGVPYAIPVAPDALYKMFLWNRPTKAAWDALYIEGKYDDGNSKNKVQDLILKALDFNGSPLHQLLGGLIQTPATPVSVPQALALPQAIQAAPVAAPPILVAPQAPAVVVPQVVAPLAPPAQVYAPPASPVPLQPPVIAQPPTALPVAAPPAVGFPIPAVAPAVAIPSVPSVVSPVLPA